MSKFVIRAIGVSVILVLGLSLAAAPSLKDQLKPKTETSAEAIRKKLDAKMSLELNAINLPTVLSQLGDENGINIVLDKGVIQQMGIDPNEMMVEVKLKDAKFRNALRTMLNQFGLTFGIVGDTLLVSTEEQVIYRQLKYRISVDFDNVPLNKAVKELSQTYGMNVVIDPRTMKNKSAESPVTLSVDDVPFEAVVRVMCEMAGLKPARMGNVIFITTEDRAEKLKDSDGLVPAPSLPGAPNVPNGFGPGGLGGAVPVPAIPAAPAIVPPAAPANPPAAPANPPAAPGKD